MFTWLTAISYLTLNYINLVHINFLPWDGVFFLVHLSPFSVNVEWRKTVFKKNFGWNNGLSSLSWIGSMFLCFGRLFQMTFPDDCFGSLFQVTISDACFRWLFRITVPDYYFRCLFQMTFPDDCFGLLFQMNISDACS